ncbi:MAG: response regulator [Deltaproteobacteria bacterium]|nr:response regulator [Deltaproteobacteria bacterium]
MSVRVLMVDDSVLVRDVLRHHLECIGCQVMAEAENTMQALDLFRTVSPALVTLDVAVPHAGGIGALALFRIMRSENPGIPILVVSASAYPEIRKVFLNEGALDYIVKPFDASSFEMVCNRLLGMFPELARVVAPPEAIQAGDGTQAAELSQPLGSLATGNSWMSRNVRKRPRPEKTIVSDRSRPDRL